MQKTKNIVARSSLYTFMLIFTGVVCYPIFLMIATSLKSNKDIFTNPYGLPSNFIFNNYSKVFLVSRYDLYFRNSFIVTLSSIALILVLSSLASYVLAKYKFAANRLIYFYFLIGIMIPIKLGTINIVQIINGLHLFDNLLSLIIVYTVMGVPLGIFILTDFIKMIPEELSNAARIDGCSDYGIFLKIILPLLRPALAAVAIVNILPIWNDFWFPLILIRSEHLKTIPLATSILYGQYETQWGMVFAVLTTASVPLIIFYLIISKQFIRGLSEGAFKG
ncbi:MAG: carbohydrate ABC transporter permease [Actinobacteria bacterium]|nr:carbohydrate ABC transporter permease [Actinomycetota bacterium]